MKRFALIAALAALLVGVAATPGSAASFDDTHPCPADGPLLVCPAAHVGQPYSLQLLAKAGCDLYRWEITNGGLPPGLSMSSSGLVTGTPTASGATQPWITVHDLLPSEGGNSWCGGDNHSERQFVFNAVPGLSIQNQSVPGGTVGQAYSQALSVFSITNTNPLQGNPTTATWSIKSGSLPPGVTLSSAGLLSGTPTAEGSWTFVVLAVGGGDTSDTETETLTVRQPITVTSPLATSGAPKAEVGMAFSVAQTATGGEGTFTWALAQGALPAGLTLNPDGSITGKPETPGRFVLSLRVTDRESRTTNVNVTLVVVRKLSISTLRLKPGRVGVAYRGTIGKIGGVVPTTWTVRGKLPNGMKFAARTGLLTGTPRKAGTYRLTFVVADSLGAEAKKALIFVVK
jgi:hypothetical protein